MKILTFGLPLLMIIATWAHGPAGLAEAAGCTSNGLGDEECWDFVNCSSGAGLWVYAAVDESNWVNGHVNCADKGTNCNGSLSCTSPTVCCTSQAGNGECSGSGNGGWYTELTVRCGGVTQETSPADPVFRDLLRKTDLLLGLPPGLEVHMTPSEGTAVWILGSRGVVTAWGCAAAMGCVPVVPDCTFRLDDWACRVGG